MSATVRPIGPDALNWSATSVNGQPGTPPGLGRSPTTLQKLDGLRSDPPRSLPSARLIVRGAQAATTDDAIAMGRPLGLLLMLALVIGSSRGDNLQTFTAGSLR